MSWLLCGLLLVGGEWGGCAVAAAERIRILTYNVENYLLTPSAGRPAKTLTARSKVQEILAGANADVVALQELGPDGALEDLMQGLQKRGRRYPYVEVVKGADTNIFVAVLSRIPMVARRSHARDSYLLFGRRFHVSRGFAEVELQTEGGYRFTVLAAHLKSRRQVAEGDEAQMREQEAMILREKVDALLKDARRNLVVCGDFNDTKDSRAIRALVGRGQGGLVDTRPGELNGDGVGGGRRVRAGYDPRTVTWTHHYGKEDTYSRVDYLLISKGMAREWVAEESRVVAVPGWGVASDHRPVLITVEGEDR